MSNFPSIRTPLRLTYSKVHFAKYAIILNEARPKNATDPIISSSVLAQKLLPKTHEEKYDDVGELSKILQDKIRIYAGVEVSLFNGREIIQENTASLVPLMFRVAVEEFARTCKNEFKIIECRNETRLSSDWKPSLPDTLNARNHQVIVVDLKESFLPYNHLVYAILRQLDRECLFHRSLRMPRSLFHPNDVCSIEATLNRSLIMLTPSMPDGDLQLSQITNQLHYDLLTLFKRSCMNALKNHLRMRDLHLGKFEDIISALARLRTTYRRVQRRLLMGHDIRMGAKPCLELMKQMEVIMDANLHTAATVMEVGQRLFEPGNEITGSVKNGESFERPYSATSSPPKAMGLFRAPITQSHSNIFSSRFATAGPFPDLSAQFSLLDEKLKAQFERIDKMLSGNGENLEDVFKAGESFEKLQNQLVRPNSIRKEFVREN